MDIVHVGVWSFAGGLLLLGILSPALPDRPQVTTFVPQSRNAVPQDLKTTGHEPAVRATAELCAATHEHHAPRCVEPTRDGDRKHHRDRNETDSREGTDKDD